MLNWRSVISFFLFFRNSRNEKKRIQYVPFAHQNERKSYLVWCISIPDKTFMESLIKNNIQNVMETEGMNFWKCSWLNLRHKRLRSTLFHFARSNQFPLIIFDVSLLVFFLYQNDEWTKRKLNFLSDTNKMTRKVYICIYLYCFNRSFFLCR